MCMLDATDACLAGGASCMYRSTAFEPLSAQQLDHVELNPVSGHELCSCYSECMSVDELTVGLVISVPHALAVCLIASITMFLDRNLA